MAPSNLAVRQLTGIASLISRNRPTAPGKENQNGGFSGWNKDDASQYFGPGIEVAPIFQDPSTARGWQYWINQNMVFTPRPDAAFTAQQLRSLANYPLHRIAIENAKDIISDLPRQIRAKKRPGEKNSDVSKRSKGDPTLKMLNDFFDCPDGEHDWGQWIRRWLEAVYVTDDACVLVRRNRMGKVLQLRTDFDGAYITVLVDEWGYTPQAPDWAYQQLWSGTPSTVGGIPFVNLTTNDLVYRPRNIVPRNTVSSFLYGFSPTEQNAQEIQIGQERLNFVQAYYTTGTIPDMIHIVPPGIASDQLSQAQKALDAEMSGQPWKRSGRDKLIQGFVERSGVNGSTQGDQIIFPKEKLLADPFDEMHIRKIFYGIGVSPQRILKAMNRASAQSGQEAAEEEGTMPIAKSVKGMVDWIIAKIFNIGFGQYELTFDDPQELDAVKRSTADKNDVESGILTREEVRVGRGLDPNPGPDMGVLTITTGTGVVPVDLDDAVDHEKDMAAAQPPPQPMGGGGKQPVKKRATAHIDPARHTPETRQAQAKLEAACVRIFDKQKAKAVAKAERILKVRKSEDSDKTADQIYDEIAYDWAYLVPEAREAIEQAGKAGVSHAIVEINADSSAMFNSVNRLAEEYASKRAAELVGMHYSDTGELVPNPSAKWAISSTTRDRLREIIKNAFSEKTPFSELIQDIRDADIFSEKRAAMIARTEVSNAQVRSNFQVWKDSGLVTKVKWLTSSDPCPTCEMNAGVIRELGKQFPSGAIYPTEHPNCYCVLQAVEFKEL